MAHQTFYIDIDEEITSIIERLKKARANEIIMVVPKRALLIQSIVNLRILKKEADENDIQLMIVTQDKLGKMLIEKAGIFVQQKIDNISNEEISLDENNLGDEEAYLNKEAEFFESKENRSRLDKIGSESYFNEFEMSENQKNNHKIIKKSSNNGGSNHNQEKLVNKELVSGIGTIMNKKISKANLDISVQPDMINKKMENTEVNMVSKNDQERKIENFFFQKNSFEDRDKRSRMEDFTSYDISKKDHKWFLLFGIISILAIISIGTFLFLPKAILKINAKIEQQSVDADITGDTNATNSDFKEKIIPARIISIESSVADNFNSSGNKSISNQKARGKITIYNEYNSSPQPLVATTRFLSSDGKIFRLVSGVTVPGMEKAGEEIKPGMIEAQVIADEAGESFNIGPDKFTIPGFKGSGEEKYSKFYAKSAENMSGGGNGNQDQTANYITDQDISSAKSKLLDKLNNDIKEKIKQSANENMIILDDAIRGDEPVYKISNASGDVVDTFQVVVQAKVRAIIVAEDDFNEMVKKMISQTGSVEEKIDGNSIRIDFGKSSIDFEKGKINIKFHATGEIIPDINLELIKEEILGKNNEELTAYLNNFSDIQDASVEYWPSFVNRHIPQIKSRVKVMLDK